MRPGYVATARVPWYLLRGEPGWGGGGFDYSNAAETIIFRTI
jgi:hypothetical protein